MSHIIPRLYSFDDIRRGRDQFDSPDVSRRNYDQFGERVADPKEFGFELRPFEVKIKKFKLVAQRTGPRTESIVGMKVESEVRDINNPRNTIQISFEKRWEPYEFHNDLDFLAHTIQSNFYELVCHEIDETLRHKGRNITNPHPENEQG